jgi:hypothetical protein
MVTEVDTQSVAWTLDEARTLTGRASKAHWQRWAAGAVVLRAAQ